MSWLNEFQDVSALRVRAARAMNAQLGLANPLWMAYGAAASAGAAWWLMAKSWQPTNLEASAVQYLPAPDPAPASTPLLAAEPVIAEVPTADMQDAVEDVAPAPVDDLTRLVGIGPSTAAALAERGVATFADLAAWTEQDLAAFDAQLKLMGRSLRHRWLEQARALAGV
jgi:predicted flap endonuclease-1-like 5' DNA nuclease